MEKIKLLTADEADKYMEYVGRLGKARELPADQLPKYRKAYDEVVSYLNKNFKAYLTYCVSGGTNRLSEAALMDCIDHATKIGLFDRIRAALAAGDAVEFGFQCKALEVVYKYYENEGRKAKKALEGLMRVG